MKRGLVLVVRGELVRDEPSVERREHAVKRDASVLAEEVRIEQDLRRARAAFAPIPDGLFLVFVLLRPKIARPVATRWRDPLDVAELR